MKLKVVESFRDKYTNIVYEKNDMIEVDEERAKELLKSPYVIVEKTISKTKNNEKEEKASTKK